MMEINDAVTMYCNSRGVSVASLNFVDMRKNTGPAVNESEFNCWLLKAVDDAKVYSPFDTERLGKDRGGRVIELGMHSLRAPLRVIRAQLALARLLAREIRSGGILYYRHSRLAFAVALLQRNRPDVVVAMTRTHPSASDTMIYANPIRRVIAKLIDKIDTRLRNSIARKARWVDCVTDVQAKLLSEATGRRVEVVMNGVNAELFCPLDETRRAAIRSGLGIPEGAIVVGYCGGFPEQRGAREISALTAMAPDMFGVVIGRLSEADRAALAHERLILMGEIEYHKVPELVACFDVAVALDVAGRPDVVGNSNQKVRQGLASGAWILTQAADLPLHDLPYLGAEAQSRDPEYLCQLVRAARVYFSMREDRADYARANLSVAAIFKTRHDAILMGLQS